MLWMIAHTLEDLAGEQVRLQESWERQEELLQELFDQTKSGSDLLELFTWRKQFLRT